MGISKKDLEGNSAKAKKTKSAFIARLRASLPDRVVPWIDVAALVSEGHPTFNILLGSGGGNDGNTHFSDNFMQNLWDCLPDFDCQRVTGSSLVDTESCLLTSLFGSPSRSLIKGRTAALLDGGRVGGPNASQGKTGEAMTNPWDFILAIEGTLCLAGAMARRWQASKEQAPAFPFAVHMVAAGYGTAVIKEAGQTEFWLPLWSRLMSMPELILLFAEGRAEVGRRRAVNGLDFARSVASLGVDSGIKGFMRVGIVKGRVGGDNYNTAVGMGRFLVHDDPYVSLLEDLEKGEWLMTLRRACSAKKPAPPQRFVSAFTRFESAFFNYCRHGTKRHLNSVLRSVGRIERELSIRGGEEVGGTSVSPAPMLTQQWAQAAYDGTPEFRIALAMASIRRVRDEKGNEAVGSLRCNLEPVTCDDGGRYSWTSRNTNAVWSHGGLIMNMIAVLQRRLIEGSRHTLPSVPLDSASVVALDDVALFMEGGTDDRLIEDLLWGLALVKQNTIAPSPWHFRGDGPPIPRSYALLKLLFLPRRDALRSISDDSPVRCEPSILRLLKSGNTQAACSIAARRLRSAGYNPLPKPLLDGRRRSLGVVGSVDPVRLAAALLIPVADVQQLKKMVLNPIKRLA